MILREVLTLVGSGADRGSGRAESPGVLMVASWWLRDWDKHRRDEEEGSRACQLVSGKSEGCKLLPDLCSAQSSTGLSH